MANEYSLERVKGFLHADGMKMVNGDGEQVVLRGWGTGNWVNLEGFMIGGPSDTTRMIPTLDAPRWFDRGRTADQAVKILCGEEYAKEFWQKWHANHLAEADIKAMADLGWICVRMVLNAGQLMNEDPSKIEFKEEGFKLIDNVLDWCEKYHIYAILDMHSAPYGHSSINIDDGIDNLPHLFLDEEAFERGVLLWEEIAKRYKDRWIVGAYELLNEPIFQFAWAHLLPELIRFFDVTIERIRKIDQKHMFCLEGQNGAHDIRPFDHDYDPGFHNWCITLHYYGMISDITGLSPFIAMAKKYNVPIWMGEGAGSPDNTPQLYEMARHFGIGWNQWCWKTAVDLKSKGPRFGVVNYELPEGWDELQKFFFGGGRPGCEKAKKIFDQMLENMKFENCLHHPEVMDPQMRRPDLDLPGVSYDYSPYPGETFSGGWDFGNVCGYRLADHTKLTVVPGKELPNICPEMMMGNISREERNRLTANKNPNTELMLELGKEGFAVYTIRDVKKPCSLNLEVYAPEGAQVKVSCEGTELASCKVKASDEVQIIPAGTVPEGECHKIRLDVTEGTLSVITLKFKY